MGDDGGSKAFRVAAELLQGVFDLSEIMLAVITDYDLDNDEGRILRALSTKEYMRFSELIYFTGLNKVALSAKLKSLGVESRDNPLGKGLVKRDPVGVDRADACRCQAYGEPSTKEEIRYSLTMGGFSVMNIVGIEREQIHLQLKEDKRMVQAAKRAKHTEAI